MKLKFLLFLLIGYQQCFSQQNSNFFIEEKQADSILQKPDSILLIGSGSVTTRVFLGDLCEHVMKKLAEKNIVANYYFLEQSSGEPKEGFDTINKKGYKAILFFLPKGASLYDVDGDMNDYAANTQTSIGTVRITTSKVSLNYEQNFSVRLCTLYNADMKEVWFASIEIKFDISKSKNARKVGDKLVYYFKKRDYIK